MVSDWRVWTTSVTGAWAKVTIDGRGRDLSRVRPGIRGRSDGCPWPSLSAQRGCAGAIGSRYSVSCIFIQDPGRIATEHASDGHVPRSETPLYKEEKT